jgi:thiol:disulfide interchange protein DsbD
MVKLLPKPGAWMDTAKNILAFPLYLTAVWLLWVAGNQSGVNTMAMALAGLVLVALAAYLYGQSLIRKVAAVLLPPRRNSIGHPYNKHIGPNHFVARAC